MVLDRVVPDDRRTSNKRQGIVAPDVREPDSGNRSACNYKQSLVKRAVTIYRVRQDSIVGGTSIVKWGIHLQARTEIVRQARRGLNAVGRRKCEREEDKDSLSGSGDFAHDDVGVHQAMWPLEWPLEASPAAVTKA